MTAKKRGLLSFSYLFPCSENDTMGSLYIAGSVPDP